MDKFIIFEDDNAIVNLGEISHAYVDEHYDDDGTWVFYMIMKNGKTLELFYDTKTDAVKDLKKLFNNLNIN